MRIALRTSGGRGEYEVSGSHGEVKVSDIFDHHIVLELLPGKNIETNNFIRHLQGKPRIRLANPGADRHIYLILADALLLPKPKREISATPGGKLQLVDNNYSIVSIQFDIVRIAGDVLVIQPTDLVLSNSEMDLARIDIIERMRILIDVWGKSAKGTDALSGRVAKHRVALMSGDEKALHEEAEAIRRLMYDSEDPLRQIVSSYGLIDQYTYWMGIHRNNVELAIIEDDHDLTDPREAARNRVKAWRMQAMRGSDGSRFSQRVKIAYNNTCLFTGYYLPKTNVTGSAGVDSAHILPWAGYDLNEVRNGLCLSKLCHWAFDAGILMLDFNESKTEYILAITQAAAAAEKQRLIDLTAFRALEGKIPYSRLPKDTANWPSPALLKEYNKSASL